MHLTEEELKQIIKEEFNNLISEEEIDEKLFGALKDLGKGLLSKAKRKISGMPDPGRSGGVGPWYLRYKEPKQEPTQPEEPEQAAEPSTAIVRRPSTAVGQPQTPQPDVERGTATATVQPRLALPSGEKTQQQPVNIVGELPPAGKLPLQLPAPRKIGIVSDYGRLMSSAENKDYEKLYESCIAQFSDTLYYKQLNFQQQKTASDNIDTVLKHLVTTKRIIQNPTIGPVNEEEARPTPSLQQIGEIDFNSWYARSLISTTKKYFSKSIPDEIIEFVIKFLFQSGRLAISQRLYNQLIHTNDPRLGPTDTLDTEKQPKEQTESKSYNNFYNNWKKYAKTGVKI